MDLDELPPQARAILAAASAADDPSPADRARIDTTFAATLRAYGIAAPPTASLPDGAAGGGAGAVKGGATGYAAKIVLVIAGAGAVAAGLWQISNRTPPRPNAAAALATAPAFAARQPAIAAHEPSAIDTAPSAASVRRPHPSTPVARLEARDDAHRIGLAASPRTRISPKRPVTSGSSSADTPRATANDSLAAEVALLKGANDAVRLGHYDRALRLLDAHAARFENGILREERRGLHVLALCGVGQTASGVEERARFLVDFPRSVLTDKVRSACAQEREDRNVARPGQP